MVPRRAHNLWCSASSNGSEKTWSRPHRPGPRMQQKNQNRLRMHISAGFKPDSSEIAGILLSIRVRTGPNNGENEPGFHMPVHSVRSSSKNFCLPSTNKPSTLASFGQLASTGRPYNMMRAGDAKMFRADVNSSAREVATLWSCAVTGTLSSHFEKCLPNNPDGFVAMLSAALDREKRT